MWNSKIYIKLGKKGQPNLYGTGIDGDLIRTSGVHFHFYECK